MNQSPVTWNGGICIVDGRGYTCTNDGQTRCVKLPQNSLSTPHETMPEGPTMAQSGLAQANMPDLSSTGSARHKTTVAQASFAL